VNLVDDLSYFMLFCAKLCFFERPLFNHVNCRHYEHGFASFEFCIYCNISMVTFYLEMHLYNA